MKLFQLSNRIEPTIELETIQEHEELKEATSIRIKAQENAFRDKVLEALEKEVEKRKLKESSLHFSS